MQYLTKQMSSNRCIPHTCVQSQMGISSFLQNRHLAVAAYITHKHSLNIFRKQEFLDTVTVIQDSTNNLFCGFVPFHQPSKCFNSDIIYTSILVLQSEAADAE